jgi:hypothetical protein
MTTLLLDCNVYDMLAADYANRSRLARFVAAGEVRVIATPVVIDELTASPFGGLPAWFAVDVEPEYVAVYGFARYGMARYGDGQVYSEHRGSSNKRLGTELLRIRLTPSRTSSSLRTSDAGSGS